MFPGGIEGEEESSHPDHEIEEIEKECAGQKIRSDFPVYEEGSHPLKDV